VQGIPLCLPCVGRRCRFVRRRAPEPHLRAWLTDLLVEADLAEQSVVRGNRCRLLKQSTGQFSLTTRNAPKRVLAWRGLFWPSERLDECRSVLQELEERGAFSNQRPEKLRATLDLRNTDKATLMKLRVRRRGRVPAISPRKLRLAKSLAGTQQYEQRPGKSVWH